MDSVFMKTRLKQFSALLLLFAFLLPSLVKMEHQHDHFVCMAKEQKHLHTHNTPLASSVNLNFLSLLPNFLIFHWKSINPLLLKAPSFTTPTVLPTPSSPSNFVHLRFLIPRRLIESTYFPIYSWG